MPCTLPWSLQTPRGACQCYQALVIAKPDETWNDWNDLKLLGSAPARSGEARTSKRGALLSEFRLDSCAISVPEPLLPEQKLERPR